MSPEVERLLIFEQRHAVVPQAHDEGCVLVALIIVHDLVEFLLELQARRVHLQQTLRQFLWLHHLRFALGLALLSKLHLLLAEVLVDVEIGVLVVLLLERHQGIELQSLLLSLLAGTRERRLRLDIQLRLIEDLLQLILALVSSFVMAALKTKNEVPLLLETLKQILRCLNFDIWAPLLLGKHTEAVVEADVGNEVACTRVLLVSGRGGTLQLGEALQLLRINQLRQAILLRELENLLVSGCI